MSGEQRVEASVVLQCKHCTATLTTSMRQDPGTTVCISPIRARLFDEEEHDG